MRPMRAWIRIGPSSPIADPRPCSTGDLLRPFRVAQELHEFVYAARFLPEWRYVPDAALPALLEGRG